MFPTPQRGSSVVDVSAFGVSHCGIVLQWTNDPGLHPDTAQPKEPASRVNGDSGGQKQLLCYGDTGNGAHIGEIGTTMEATMTYQFNEQVGVVKLLDATATANPVWDPQVPTLDSSSSTNPYGDTLAAIAAMLRFHLVAFLWGIAVVMINLAALIWFTGVVVYQTVAHPINWMIANVQAAPGCMDYTADSWTVR